MRNKKQDTGYKMQDRENHESCIMHRASFVLFTVYCLLSASIAFAGGGEAGHTPLWREYLWKIINFGILVFVIVVLAKKMDIKGYLKRRTELIEKSLKEAQEAKELAQKALAEVEERLRIKDREIEKIMSSAKQSGENEKARLIGEGERMKAKILEQARMNIEYELKEAKAVIRAEAVEIAIELAEKKLKERLGRKEQEMLLEESITKIEGRK